MNTTAGGHDPVWEPEGEPDRTWRRHVAIDPDTREAVVIVTTTTTERFRLRLGPAALAGLIADLEWARERLRPVAEWVGKVERQNADTARSVAAHQGAGATPGGVAEVVVSGGGADRP